MVEVAATFVETLNLKLKVVSILKLLLVLLKNKIFGLVLRDEFLHLDVALVFFENVS